MCNLGKGIGDLKNVANTNRPFIIPTKEDRYTFSNSPFLYSEISYR